MRLKQKMKHVTRHVQNINYDVCMDLEEMTKSKNGKEFFWFVRKRGATIIPSPHIFIKDSTYNIIAREMAKNENTRIYFVSFEGYENDEEVGGDIRVITNLPELLDQFTGMPCKITGKVILTDGKEVEETIDYTPYYYEAILEKAEVPREAVEIIHINKVIF